MCCWLACRGPRRYTVDGLGSLSTYVEPRERGAVHTATLTWSALDTLLYSTLPYSTQPKSQVDSLHALEVAVFADRHLGTYCVVWSQDFRPLPSPSIPVLD